MPRDDHDARGDEGDAGHPQVVDALALRRIELAMACLLAHRLKSTPCAPAEG